MALAIRSARSDHAWTRAHGDVAVRPLGRPAPAVEAAPRRPRLAVVAPRRRTAGRVTLLCAGLFAVMVGALAFQTQVARDQFRLDRLDKEIRIAREQYDALRRERAELRSPGRLMAAAQALGMVSGDLQPTDLDQFTSIDPDVVATVQRMGSAGGSRPATVGDADFSAYAAVKAQTGGTP